VFYIAFNNISVISWRTPECPGKNHRAVASHLQNLLHIEYTSPWTVFELTTLVVIGTDSSGSSNYHTDTTTTSPILIT